MEEQNNMGQTVKQRLAKSSQVYSSLAETDLDRNGQKQTETNRIEKTDRNRQKRTEADGN